MAVQPWELSEHPVATHPRLKLVTPPPRRRPVAASLFVLFVALTVGSPVIVSAVEGPPPPLNWSFRPPPATAIDSLDPVAPLPRRLRPGSREPVPGIVFVRCTRLWTARSDGSQQRALLEMPGISSPTFSPDARTVAFLVGNEIWMAGADGSAARHVATITAAGDPVHVRATGLTWSQTSGRLAFALVSPNEDLWSGGSVIFTLDLASGTFSYVGHGWPAPFWFGNDLAYAAWLKHTGGQFSSVGGERVAGQMSSPGEELTAASAPSPFRAVYERPAAVLRLDERGTTKLVLGSYYFRHPQPIAPPRGYTIVARSRPALTEDGSGVVVDLRDASGERDLGLYDVATRRWSVLDYAWQATTSPLPSTTGPLGARRALRATRDLLDTWNRSPANASLLLGKRRKNPLVTFDRLRYTIGAPGQTDDGWTVPTTVFGKTKQGRAYRDVSVRVSERKGRLLAEPTAIGELRSIRTIGDAVAFLDHVVDADVVAPAGLPAGTKLDRNALYAWSYRGDTTGTLNLVLPDGGRATISYGGNNSFSLGCGGVAEDDTERVDVAGQPGAVAQLDDYSQVLWPLKGRRMIGTYSVYIEGPKELALSIARAMEAVG